MHQSKNLQSKTFNDTLNNQSIAAQNASVKNKLV